MPTTSKGLSDEKAARMMAALREGGTLNNLGVRAPRLEAYFNAHPEYGSRIVKIACSVGFESGLIGGH